MANDISNPQTPLPKPTVTLVYDPTIVSPDAPTNDDSITANNFSYGPASKIYSLQIYLDSKEIELPDRYPSPTPSHELRAISGFFDPENEIGDEIFDEYPFLRDIPTPPGSPILSPACAGPEVKSDGVQLQSPAPDMIQGQEFGIDMASLVGLTAEEVYKVIFADFCLAFGLE